MSRRKKDRLRELMETERQERTRVIRSRVASAIKVEGARILLAVALGETDPSAVRAVIRRSGDAVAHLVARFNAEGTAALAPRHGGGRVVAEHGGEPAVRILKRRALDGQHPESTDQIIAWLETVAAHWDAAPTRSRGAASERNVGGGNGSAGTVSAAREPRPPEHRSRDTKGQVMAMRKPGGPPGPEPRKSGLEPHCIHMGTQRVISANLLAAVSSTFCPCLSHGTRVSRPAVELLWPNNNL